SPAPSPQPPTPNPQPPTPTSAIPQAPVRLSGKTHAAALLTRRRGQQTCTRRSPIPSGRPEFLERLEPPPAFRPEAGIWDWYGPECPAHRFLFALRHGQPPSSSRCWALGPTSSP